MLTVLIALFAGLGGLSGLAAFVNSLTAKRSTRVHDVVDERSIAIQEIEKVIPGMGGVIIEWKAIVLALREENVNLRQEIQSLRDEIDRLRSELVKHGEQYDGE